MSLPELLTESGTESQNSNPATELFVLIPLPAGIVSIAGGKSTIFAKIWTC